MGTGNLQASIGWVARGHRYPIGTGAHGARVPASISTHWHGHGCLAPSLQEHFNYYSLDPTLGHLVFSLKYDEQEHLHLLLR